MPTGTISPRLAPLLAVALGAGACRSVQWVPIPDPSVAVEDPSKARIYVARQSRVHLWGVSRVVLDDEREVGKLKNGEHLCWEREPGKAVISLGRRQYDQLFAEWMREDPVDLELELTAGGVYTLQATPMKVGEARERKAAAGDTLAAWSLDPDTDYKPQVWELRLLGPEAAGELIAASRAAAFRERGNEQRAERYSAPDGSFSLPVPPIGERTVESPDGDGVAFVNHVGHALVIEWIDLPPGWEEPRSVEHLGELAAALDSGSSGGSGESVLLEIEGVEGGERPMIFALVRVPQGSHWTRGTLLGFPGERLDSTRAILLLARGGRVWALSWRPAPFLVDIEGEGLGEESKERLLELLGALRFE